MRTPIQLCRGQPEQPYPRQRWLHLLSLLVRAVEQDQPIDLVRTPVVVFDELVKVVLPDDPLGPTHIKTENLSTTLARELPLLLAHVSDLREAVNAFWYEYEKLQGGEVDHRHNWPRYHTLAAQRKELLGE